MSFGARLAQARKSKGMTQTDLGKGLGTDGTDASKAVVYGWEKDQHFPRVDQLRLICEKLGVSAQHLVFGNEAALPLEPDVAQVASDISSLPPRQRDWVLMTAREAITLARETITVNGKPVTQKDEDFEQKQARNPRRHGGGR